jgi:hypothetical protein
MHVPSERSLNLSDETSRWATDVSTGTDDLDPSAQLSRRLYVDDLDEMVCFYTQLVGFVVTDRGVPRSSARAQAGAPTNTADGPGPAGSFPSVQLSARYRSGSTT